MLVVHNVKLVKGCYGINILCVVDMMPYYLIKWSMPDMEQHGEKNDFKYCDDTIKAIK